MNVSLTPEIESWVQEKVESGFYQSASEVVREALRLLRGYEKERDTALQDLRAELMIGMYQLEKGEGIVADKPFFDSVKARGRDRKAKREQG